MRTATVASARSLSLSSSPSSFRVSERCTCSWPATTLDQQKKSRRRRDKTLQRMVATRNSSSGGAGEAGGGVTLDGRSLIVGPKAAEVLRELQVTDAVIVDGKGDLSETEINKEIGEQGEAPVLGNESALRVWQGNLLDLPLYYGPFDQVIVGEDEYKKSDSASEVVGKCAEILSPGGTFLVYGVESSRNALQELVQVRSLALDKHPFVAFEPSTQQQRSLPPNAICLQLPEGYLFQESPVRLKSTVVHGFKRGSKQLGFPTANLHVPTIESQIEGLKSGVYFGWAKVNFKDGSRQDEFGKHPRKVVVNIGERPSFEDGSNITIEVHVMDYEGGEDFYGEEMCVILLGFIRAEMKFDGIDMLIGRIKQDVSRVFFVSLSFLSLSLSLSLCLSLSLSLS